MITKSFQDPWVKKARYLTQALIISGTINVGLLATFIYFALNENHSSFPIPFEKTSIEQSSLKNAPTLQEVLLNYSTLSFQELLLCLNNREHVESGYTKRDLALACLCTFHHFNLERALGGLIFQKRELSFGENKIVMIFPGLADYQYQAISYYAKTEQWPLTSYGLFLQIQSSKLPYDPSLLEAFYLTPEYHFINLLFSKTGVSLKKEHMVALLAQANWQAICQTVEQVRKSGEFSEEKRRQFLLQLSQSSRLAAKVLLETDLEYCSKYLDNEQVLILCDLLGDKTPPVFLKELLESPRSDEIWKKAAAILYEQAAETAPENLELASAKSRFIELKATPVVRASSPKGEKIHIVVAGDSLWKIARQHQTSVQVLKDLNSLKTERLQLGQKIKIP